MWISHGQESDLSVDQSGSPFLTTSGWQGMTQLCSNLQALCSEVPAAVCHLPGLTSGRLASLMVPSGLDNSCWFVGAVCMPWGLDSSRWFVLGVSLPDWSAAAILCVLIACLEDWSGAAKL